MNIQSDQLRAAARRSAGFPKLILKPRALDYIPERKRPETECLLAARTAFLGEGGAPPSPKGLERITGSNDLVDEFCFDRALLAAMLVCRFILRSPNGHDRGYATGFIVSRRLMLTNEHVFRGADEAAPSSAEFNYRLDVGIPDSDFAPFSTQSGESEIRKAIIEADRNIPEFEPTL